MGNCCAANEDLPVAATPQDLKKKDKKPKQNLEAGIK